MHLALVTHKLLKGDGQGRVNYELAREALAQGHTVSMLASEVAPELAAHPLARVVRLGSGALPSALLKNQVFAWHTTRWLRRHRHEVDLVHLNGFASWARSDVNTSHFVHAAWIRSRFHTWRVRRDGYGLYQWLYSWSGTWLERHAYDRSRVVVAVSEQVRRELIDAGLDPARLRVISNGVDTEEFAPDPAARAALGLPTGPLALFVGDIRTPRKNLDTLLRAMVQVGGASLLVVGDASASPYPRLAAQLGLAGRVHFLGFRRDIARLMAAVDLFVFPSRYEACSLVLLEAAASGLPIIAARSTGGTELLDERCSLLIEDPDDEGALAAAMNRLLGDREGLARMAVEARRAGIANSWKGMAERYLRLYADLLAEPSAPESGRPRRVAAA